MNTTNLVTLAQSATVTAGIYIVLGIAFLIATEIRARKIAKEELLEKTLSERLNIIKARRHKEFLEQATWKEKIGIVLLWFPFAVRIIEQK